MACFSSPLYMAGGSKSRDRRWSLSTSRSACDSPPETAIVSAICRGTKEEEKEKIPPWSSRRFNLFQISSGGPKTGGASRNHGRLQHLHNRNSQQPLSWRRNLSVTVPGCNAAAARAPIGWWTRAAANATEKQKKPPAPKKKEEEEENVGFFTGRGISALRKEQQMKMALADLFFKANKRRNRAVYFLFVCARTFRHCEDLSLLGRSRRVSAVVFANGLHQSTKELSSFISPAAAHAPPPLTCQATCKLNFLNFLSCSILMTLPSSNSFRFFSGYRSTDQNTFLLLLWKRLRHAETLFE